MTSRESLGIFSRTARAATYFLMASRTHNDKNKNNNNNTRIKSRWSKERTQQDRWGLWYQQEHTPREEEICLLHVGCTCSITNKEHIHCTCFIASKEHIHCTRSIASKEKSPDLAETKSIGDVLSYSSPRKARIRAQACRTASLRWARSNTSQSTASILFWSA